MFKIIEGSYFRQKDMYEYIGIIHCHPFCISESVDCGRFAVCTFTGKLLDRVYNSIYLTRGVPLAYNEIFADGIFYTG